MDYHSEALVRAEARIHQLELHVQQLQWNEESRKGLNKEIRRGIVVLAWVFLWCAWILLLAKMKAG